MTITIRGKVKKYIFAAPIRGSMDIDIPMECLVKNKVKKAILDAISKNLVSSLHFTGCVNIDNEETTY